MFAIRDLVSSDSARRHAQTIDVESVRNEGVLDFLGFPLWTARGPGVGPFN